MFEFVYEFEDKEVYNGLEAKIPIPHLKLRQKQIDALLAHDITKLYCTKQGGCILLFSKDTDFVPVLEAAWEKGFEVFKLLDEMQEVITNNVSHLNHA